MSVNTTALCLSSKKFFQFSHTLFSARFNIRFRRYPYVSKCDMNVSGI